MDATNTQLPDDWVAACGVCHLSFLVRAHDSPDNPGPHGTFCPGCQGKKFIAPGVLHWKRRDALPPQEAADAAPTG